MNRIALFDFDGTLISNDSFILFARTSLGWRRLCWAVLLESPWLFLWKLRFISNAKAKQRLFSTLFGSCPVERFERYCIDFVEVIDKNLNITMMKQVVKLRAEGYQIAIVSASISLWIIPWAEKHGIDVVIATEAEIDYKNHQLTGRFSTPNCFGDEKVKRIREFFPDIDKLHSVAFSDSRSDIPMLHIATHGILINK